jgi:hypothetical protein
MGRFSTDSFPREIPGIVDGRLGRKDRYSVARGQVIITAGKAISFEEAMAIAIRSSETSLSPKGSFFYSSRGIAVTENNKEKSDGLLPVFPVATSPNFTMRASPRARQIRSAIDAMR